jgi:predicted ATPase
LEAAKQVCPGDGVEDRDVLDLLASLADMSLVVVEQDGGHYRYRLLETVRQYARGRLVQGGAEDAVRERHRDYFLGLATEAAPKLRGAEQAEWVRRLQEEHENLRVGLGWCVVAARSEEGLRLCGLLLRF